MENVDYRSANDADTKKFELNFQNENYFPPVSTNSLIKWKNLWLNPSFKPKRSAKTNYVNNNIEKKNPIKSLSYESTKSLENNPSFTGWIQKYGVKGLNLLSISPTVWFYEKRLKRVIKIIRLVNFPH